MEGAFQEKIGYERLRLQCSLAVQVLLELQTLEMPGEHGKGIFRVRLAAETDDREIINDMQNTPVVLWELDSSGNPLKTPLFSGYLEEVCVSVEGGYREAVLTVLSGTILLDRMKRNRVFQNPAQKYSDVAGRVLKDTANGAHILTVQDKPTGVPFFQYQETDWAFLKRVASHLGLPLVADSSYYYPRFYMGLRQGSMRELPMESSYTQIFDGERYYELSGKEAAVVRDDFFCYHLTTGFNLDLGERVSIDGRELSVSKKEMVLQDGEVVFHYCLAGKSYNLIPKKQNTDLIGMELSGQVISTEGEKCELALDIEPEQAGGYRYSFAPETGNFMYCMPQAQTWVNLNLGSGEESDAMILGCVRTNGAECEGTGEPSKKNFHTEYGKGLELYPESMGLTGGQTGALLLDDIGGASLSSAGSLLAYAKGSIRLESGEIIGMETLSGIFAEALQASTASLCVNERFDYLSAGTLLQGSIYQAYPPYDDAPKEGKFDWGGFFRNMAIGLAVFAVCAVAAVITVASAGTMTVAAGALAGAAIGALVTTAAMSVEDYNSGNVRSTEDAVLEIVVSAISGAVTGALGIRFPGMNKVVSGLVDTAFSTAERGIIGWFTEDMTFKEWLAYTFDPATMALDFLSGVAIDFAVDGLGKLINGKNVKQMTDGLEDSVERSVKSGSTSVQHAVGSANQAQSVLNGIDPQYFNSNSRFGGGFYVGADSNTIVAELAEHGNTAKYAISYDMNLSGQKVLDLTDATIASKWDYVQNLTSTEACQEIGALARNQGYNVIKFQSYRGSGVNYVIYNNFEDILIPRIVTPID